MILTQVRRDGLLGGNPRFMAARGGPGQRAPSYAASGKAIVKGDYPVLSNKDGTGQACINV